MWNGTWGRCCGVAQQRFHAMWSWFCFQLWLPSWEDSALDALHVVLHCWLLWHEPDMCSAASHIKSELLQTTRQFLFLVSPDSISAVLLHVFDLRYQLLLYPSVFHDMHCTQVISDLGKLLFWLEFLGNRGFWKAAVANLVSLGS